MSARIVITGSRHWDDEGLIRHVLARLPKDAVIAHGDARGADQQAAHVATELGLIVVPYPVEPCDGRWPGAGPRRNRRMVDDFYPDRGIAFRAIGKSNGTDDCVSYMRAIGLEVEIVHPRPCTVPPGCHHCSPLEPCCIDRGVPLESAW